MDERWWIWVHDKTTGNERWAKNNDGSDVVALSLDAAIRKCADWNTRAERHEYSVRRYTSASRKVRVTVEIDA